ncbi:hypothetical protein, partial [Dialister succinatiphilus]|uniref:hypothetical protein n=1 Tax=Dialister succinatiphilus TaxID=487173 RepID=UPI0040299DBE
LLLFLEKFPYRVKFYTKNEWMLPVPFQAVHGDKTLQIYFKNPIDFFHQGSIISTITRKNEWQGSG